MLEPAFIPWAGEVGRLYGKKAAFKLIETVRRNGGAVSRDEISRLAPTVLSGTEWYENFRSFGPGGYLVFDSAGFAVAGPFKSPGEAAVEAVNRGPDHFSAKAPNAASMLYAAQFAAYRAMIETIEKEGLALT